MSPGRAESNAILRDWCSHIRGSVLSIGSGQDTDGDGATYREYFTRADLYLTSEPRLSGCDLILDVRRMPSVEDERFDAVFCSGVLEHVDDEAKALSEIRRVLRPGGRLLVNVPAFMFLYGLQDVVSEHKRRYRRPALVEVLRRSGFQVDYASYFNTLLFPPIAAVRVFRRLFPASTPSGNGTSDFDLRLPGVVESALEKLFALERHAIGPAALPFGISILCSAKRP